MSQALSDEQLKRRRLLAIDTFPRRLQVECLSVILVGIPSFHAASPNDASCSLSIILHVAHIASRVLNSIDLGVLILHRLVEENSRCALSSSTAPKSDLCRFVCDYNHGPLAIVTMSAEDAC